MGVSESPILPYSHTPKLERPMILDRLSEFLSQRRGLPTMIAIGLVIVNFVLRAIPGLEAMPVVGIVVGTDLFLHLGIVVGLLGILLSAALG